MCVGHHVPRAPHAALCAVIPSDPSKARAESDPVISVLPLIGSLPVRAGTAAKCVNKVVRLSAKLEPLVIDHGPYCGRQGPFSTLSSNSSQPSRLLQHPTHSGRPALWIAHLHGPCAALRHVPGSSVPVRTARDPLQRRAGRCVALPLLRLPAPNGLGLRHRSLLRQGTSHGLGGIIEPV